MQDFLVFYAIYGTPFVVLLGFIWGHTKGEKYILDASVQDQLAPWYQKAVLLAKARKEGNDILHKAEGRRN